MFLAGQIKEYLKLLRITDWIKNLFVFVPLVFSKNLQNQEQFIQAIITFFVFSFSSSFIYIINDISDINSDRNHPVKKLRPLARGSISVKNAIMMSAALLVIILISLISVNYATILILIVYILLNIFYSLYLKHLIIIDIFCIAAGFMLRVVAGAYTINVEISSWLLLTTLFISLFLAAMKRRSELVNISSNDTRKVLQKYSLEFLHQIISITLTCVIVSYALYTVSEKKTIYQHDDKLVYTTIFVIFGLFRYLYIVYQKNMGEDVTKLLIKDIPLLTNLFLYIVTILGIIYL